MEVFTAWTICLDKFHFNLQVREIKIKGGQYGRPVFFLQLTIAETIGLEWWMIEGKSIV